MKFIETFGLKVFSDDLSKIKLNEVTCLLTTISPNSYGISTKDLLFRETLKNTDYLVLDGVYFGLASILLKCKSIKENKGLDVFYHFMNRMDKVGGKVFFLGSTDGTLKKITNRSRKDFPNVIVDCYSPPYKESFNLEENNMMCEAINSFNPDILLVGMTAPKQEKWSYINKHLLNAKLICCIGAVFDWYAGNEKTIKPIWWKLRLGWLIRTIYRPEIIKRYPNIFIFVGHLFLALLGFKKYRYGDF